MRNHFRTRGLCLVAATSLIAVSTAQAAYIINVVEVGSDVVAAGSGSFNTAGLSIFATASISSRINPSVHGLTIGPTSLTSVDAYSTIGGGPLSIGSSITTFANSGSGPTVGLSGGALYLPTGYVSNSVLAPSTASWTNKSFATLGVTPGTYTYTWGSGPTADSITLNIAVPEPAGLSVLAFAGAAMLRRRRRQNPTT